MKKVFFEHIEDEFDTVLELLILVISIGHRKEIYEK